MPISEINPEHVVDMRANPALAIALGHGPFDTTDYPALCHALADVDDLATIDRATRGAARIYGDSLKARDLALARKELFALFAQQQGRCPRCQREQDEP